jgi:tetratricopeptide (TPR) repeat protein
MMLIVNLNKALNEGMKNKNIFIQLIKIYVKKGLFENGLEVCESGLNRNPQDSILLKLKIEILLREKTLSTLIKEYELKAKEDKSLNNLKVLSMLYLNADDSHWFEKLSNLIESQGIVDFETYYQIGGGYYQRASNIKKIVDRMDNEMYLSKGGIYEKELEMLFLKSLKYLESAYVIRQDTGLKEIINQLYVQLKVSPLKRKF